MKKLLKDKNVPSFIAFSKAHKTLMGSLVTFIILLGAFQIASVRFTDRVVGSLIKELIINESNGLYKLNYSSIRYSLWTNKFVLTDLKILTDTVELNNLPDTASYVEIHCPNFFIDLDNVLDTYLHNKLLIDGIYFYQPSFQVFNRNTYKAKNLSMSTGDVYMLLADYLDLFSIDALEIENGLFELQYVNDSTKEGILMNDISVIIQNMDNDSTANNKNKLFFTDQISVEINNQVLELAGTGHTVMFDKVFLSTSDSTIIIKNLEVVDRNIKNRQNDNFQSLNFKVPELILKNVDFKKAHHTNILDIKSLIISTPSFDYRKVSDGLRIIATEASEDESRVLIFDAINIGEFLVENAMVELDLSRKKRRQQFSFDSLDLRITNLTIDDSIAHDRTKFMFDDAFFNMKSNQILLPDSVHIASFKHLAGTSEGAMLSASDVDIKPRSDIDIEKMAIQNGVNTVMDIHIDKITSSDTWLLNLLNEDTLRIASIKVEQPKVSLYQLQKNEQHKGISASYTDFIDGLTKYNLGFYLFAFQITNGNLSHYKGYKRPVSQFDATGVDLSVKDIRLDSTMHGVIRQLDTLGISTYIANLHLSPPLTSGYDIKIRDLELDPDGERYSTGSLLVSDDQNTKLLQVARIALAGLNKEDLQQGLFIMDSLIIEQPEILALPKKTKLDPNIQLNDFNWPYIKIEYAEVDQAKAQITNAQDTILWVANLNIQAKDILGDTLMAKDHFLSVIPGELSAVLNHLKYYDSLRQVKVQLGSLVFSTVDSMLWLRSFNVTNASQGQFRNDIGEMKITNISWQKLLKSGQLQCHEVDIQGMNTSLAPNSNLNRLKSENDPRQVPAMVDSITNSFSAQHISISNGALRYAWQGETHRETILGKYQLTISNFNNSSPHPIESLNIDDLQIDADNIKYVFNNNEDSAYINKFRFGARKGDIILQGVGINKTKTKDQDFSALYSNQLKISGVDIDNFFLRKALTIDTLTVMTPTGSFEFEPKSKTKDTEDKKAFYPFDTTMVKGVYVNHINLVDGNFGLTSHTEKGAIPLAFQYLDFKVDSLQINEQTWKQDNSLAFSKNFWLHFESFRINLPDSLNSIQIGETTLDQKAGTLQLSDFGLIPRIGKYKFGPAKGKQAAWISVFSPSFTINGLDYNALVQSGKLLATKITIDKMELTAFKDKRVLFDENQRRELPQYYIRNAPIGLSIDSIILKEATITYQEHSAEGVEAGELFFNNLDANILNVTNDTTVLKTRQKMFLDAEAWVMGEGFIQLTSAYDLVDEYSSFNLGAVLHEMDLTKLNKIMEPTAFIKIKSGYNEKLLMNVRANNDVAYGEMSFKYNDLRINIINKNTQEAKGVGPQIGSFFANTFIINRNNPRLFRLKKGDIYYERDKKRMVIQYWARCFLSGAVSSIGAKSNKKDIKKAFKDATNKINFLK